MSDFVPFPKIGRLQRDIIITEKLDGTNGVIEIGEDGTFRVGSRSRWLTEEKSGDNYGFRSWAMRNKDELMRLGGGRHYGEWWGNGIARGYGLLEKKFSLFNTRRWHDPISRPSCCEVVPVLYTGRFDTQAINACLANLRTGGSVASPGFLKPEGVVIFHTQSGVMFKQTIENDEAGKGRDNMQQAAE